MKTMIAALLLLGFVLSGKPLAAGTKRVSDNGFAYCSGKFASVSEPESRDFICSGGKTYSGCIKTSNRRVFNCTHKKSPYACSLVGETIFACQLISQPYR